MLKPIHKVGCSPALAACQKLMQTFALWLSDPATKTVTRKALRSAMPSQIEADWLWALLKKKEDDRPLLERALTVATLPDANKVLLKSWVDSVADLAGQFGAPAHAWPVANPILPKQAWMSFKTLMLAFYSKGLRDGLPYQPDGTAIGQRGATYAHFLATFRSKHRLSTDPEAREVCVLCGGPLGEMPQVDHWIGKSPYPLLSVCADNLLPACGSCNSSSNKGTKPVHSNGLFNDWFHPYLRPGTGRLRPHFVQGGAPLDLACECVGASSGDGVRVQTCDELLNLSKRWKRELKSEHSKHRGALRHEEERRIKSGGSRYTLGEVATYIDDWRRNLLSSEPHFEVHSELGAALADPARLKALHDDLINVR